MSNKTLYRYMQSTFYIYMNLSNSDYFHIPCNLCRRGSIHMIRNANCFPHIDNSYIFCNLKYGSNRYTYNLSHNDMHLCCKHKIWNIYNLYNVYIPGKKCCLAMYTFYAIFTIATVYTVSTIHTLD